MDSTIARTWLPVGAVVIIIIAVGAYAFTHRTVAPAPTPGTSLTSSTTAALPPVINDFWGGGKPVNLLDATLVVRELDSSTSTVQVDKATLGLVSTSTSPTYYFKDANNVYFFDSGSNENQQPRPRKKNPNPVPTPYILYRLPLSPASFRVLSYDYIADDTQVYYFDEFGATRDGFLPVSGIDAKTAYVPGAIDKSVDFINSSLDRDHVVADTQNVYVGTAKLIANKDVRFLDWDSGDKTYATTYGVTGSSVICISDSTEHPGGLNEGITSYTGHVLAADASSFKPILINGQNFYAEDASGHVFVNCTPLGNGPVTAFVFETTPADSQGNVNELLLLTNLALYDTTGHQLVARTGALSGFKYLDTTGDYFTLDGKAYWYQADWVANSSNNYAYLINNGSVDLSSFAIIDSWRNAKIAVSDFGVAKDARQVYIDYSDGYTDHHAVAFTPKDIATFSEINCPSLGIYFKDSQAVYDKDGAIVAGADPATFVTNDARCSEPFNGDGY